MTKNTKAVQSLEWNNLAELLLYRAEHSPSGGLIYPLEESLNDFVLCTCPALVEEARRILGGLRAAGRKPGHKVALLLQHPRDFLPAFWACILGGYVACPLAMPRGDKTQRAAQLLSLARLLEGPSLITTRELQAELPSVEGLSVATLELLRASAPDAMTFQARREDLALLVLTSGSTGNSKAVMLTHGNLLASMPAKAERQELASSDVTLNWIAFDHVAGLLECHLLPLYVGASQLHVESHVILNAPLRFLELIDAYKVTMTFTQNFLLGHINKALAHSRPERSLDLSSLRVIVCGGEAIVCRTAETFLELLAPFKWERSLRNAGPRSDRSRGTWLSRLL